MDNIKALEILADIIVKQRLEEWRIGQVIAGYHSHTMNGETPAMTVALIKQELGLIESVGDPDEEEGID